MVPGQGLWSASGAGFSTVTTPIVLDCSLPQIRSWLHCPNPTTTPRCLFVGRMNTSCSMGEEKKKGLKPRGQPLQSSASSVADRMFPLQPLPGSRPGPAFLKWIQSGGDISRKLDRLSPPKGELGREETPKGFSWALSSGLCLPGGTSRS